jgi:hypothetical protein
MHAHTHTDCGNTAKCKHNTWKIPLMLQLTYSYRGTHAGTKVRAGLHTICIKISMSDASQETYAHRNNSGLFAGLFYNPKQLTNDEKSQWKTKNSYRNLCWRGCWTLQLNFQYSISQYIIKVNYETADCVYHSALATTINILHECFRS